MSIPRLFGHNLSQISYDDSAAMDAFGRLRVSEPVTLFDSKQIFDNAPLFWDDREVSGADTTSTYLKAAARSRLAVSATTEGKRMRQTFMRFNYQSGKSHLVLMTGVLGTGASGIIQEIGLFDDDNGIFFRNVHGVVNVVLRSSVTGSAVDTVVAQPDWSEDAMDGSGLSNVITDWSKTQIFLLDFEWLAVGRVRIGLFAGGVPVYVHEFLNANMLDVAYMSTPNLPLRYAIENDGAGAAASMDAICATVISEGGSDALGILHSAGTDGTHVDCDTENTTYAIVGLRLKAANLAASVNILNLAVAEHQGTKEYRWELIFNPTVADTFTYADITNSSLQSATGATANTVTGGTIIVAGLGSSAQKGGSQDRAAIDNALRLGSAIDGTPDEIVLCVTPIGGSTTLDIEGLINWRELS